ncbi:hypothetical protein SAMN05421796_10916 [Chryseobacterium piscicola]|uniref:Uncharacterized protein n=1 Tax=Chryseobacterium piscicola TaxID=551459 RepID=A0A1N7NRN9_9FLAO|nr:hypothetical protein SAMN05421796_10916 [Chryseobacterium piscicola]
MHEFLKSCLKKNHEKTYKPDSVSQNRDACYLSTLYITAQLELITPRFSGRAVPIFIAEKHRYTYHCTAKSLPGFTTAELYILSVALVLSSQMTDVIRFAALWCPDFPTLKKMRINRPVFSWLQR